MILFLAQSPQSKARAKINENSHHSDESGNGDGGNNIHDNYIYTGNKYQKNRITFGENNGKNYSKKYNENMNFKYKNFIF